MLNNVTRSPVDVEFRNLSYSVGRKNILKSISGKFPSGCLTALLGTSGAGKSSLLNILAGYIQGGVDGKILVNGKPRQMKEFHKMSCYIMQEDLLQPFLTTREAMSIAARLKLGHGSSADEKEAAIKEVVTSMGLEKCLDARVENISGGQRRRLSVALELLNNPPVIFLDEPTTGLDEVSAKNCIQFLKQMTLEGRTIVCTIHQPSDSMFQLFDQAYIMTNGYCVYSGGRNEMVEFLTGVSLPCPPTHSPVDYIIELVNHEEQYMQLLKHKTESDQKMKLREEMINKETREGSTDTLLVDDHSKTNGFSTTFLEQFCILSQRMLRQLLRNKILLALAFGTHISAGIFNGLLFRGVGNDGNKMISNMGMMYSVMACQLFMHVMPYVLIFPSEVKLLQREYFNRWYSLKAYYLALSLTWLPLAVIPTLLFTTFVYTMTDQPMEANRFLLFSTICVITAITSQSLGHAIGSLFLPTNGAIIFSTMIIVLVLLAIHGSGYADELSSTIKFLMSLSYARHCYAGFGHAFLDGRPLLDCGETFCYYSDTRIVLRLYGMENQKTGMILLFLTVFMALHKICVYVFLKIKITPGSAITVAKYCK